MADRPSHHSPSGNANGGYGWLEVEYHRCKTRASILLDAIRRPRHMPIWKLGPMPVVQERGGTRRPVHMIKLTQEREIT